LPAILALLSATSVAPAKSCQRCGPALDDGLR
jgi:hypothetical protein